MPVAALPQSSPSDHRVKLVLTTTTRPEGTRTIIALRGDADLSGRPALADILSRVIASGDGDVVIDLAELGFVDTSIVRTFTVLRQFLTDRDRQLTFRSPSRLAARILHSFGLSDRIESGPQTRPRTEKKPADSTPRPTRRPAAKTANPPGAT